MEENIIIFKPIGIIHTPFTSVENMPIQPFASENVRGYIDIFPEFIEGLNDLDGFSHITLIYHFHLNSTFRLKVKPFMDNTERGVFACRAPKRPNAVGISTVKLLGIQDNILKIEQVDMLDGTPLMDIKPFFEKFDNRFNTKSGWLEKSITDTPENLRSDKRFKD